MPALTNNKLETTPIMPPATNQPVYLYLLPLSPTPGDHSEVEAWPLLSDSERTRADSFRLAASRQGYIQVRAQLRRCLATHTGIPAKALAFHSSAHGKPALINSPAAFNLSHSGDWLAIAIGHDCDLGVDLEPHSATRAWSAIAARYYHQEENRWLASLPEGEAQLAFYRLWTLKESLLKARGTGIATGLDKACFELKDQDIAIRLATELKEENHYWQVHQWQWHSNFYLALTIRCTAAPMLPLEVIIEAGQDTPLLLGQGSLLPA